MFFFVFGFSKLVFSGNSLKRDYCHELSRSIDPVVVVQTPKFVPVHEEKILQADERKRVPKLSDPDAVKVVMDDDSVDVKAQNVFQSMLPKTVKVLHEQPTDGANLQEGDQFIVVVSVSQEIHSNLTLVF